ncbi:LysR family transcriptional regulator [Leptospira sp. 201903071]|uniref:LysR family transcriptional regulator n=1 Tax=Leptospira ainazelensis TaxID=2810034 RepID=UPI001963DA49|nr:LysR family transcriptional regulator [Leptospira ainazelensis]MBM9500371.1 LysR family transcriptional regulator [Leptospira ainazelensis]
MNIESILDLELFEAVCVEGNFAKAARKTGSSLPTISKRISRLERALKVTLFERTTRTIRLTEAGTRFRLRAERILTELRNAEKEAVFEKELKGKIRITAPAPFATRVLPPILAEFRNQHPEIQLEVVFGNEKFNLIEERFDLGIRIMKPIRGERCKLLLPNRIVAVASPNYLEKVGTPSRLADLEKHPILFVDEQANVRIPELKKTISELSSDRGIRSNNGSFLAEFIARGGSGILFRSIWDVEEQIESGKIKRIFPSFHWKTEASVCLLFPSGEKPPKRVLRFGEFLESKIFPGKIGGS